MPIEGGYKMAVKIQTSSGIIEISNEVIATVVGGAATDVFGIVGMASKKQIKDNINEIYEKENYSRGVVVRQEENGIAVDVYTIVSYGTKDFRSFPQRAGKSEIQLRNDARCICELGKCIVQGVRVLPD